MQSFGLLGDIHAEDERLAAALAYLRSLGVDAILSVGDVVDGPGDVDRCVRLLVQHEVVGVRGNHDRWLVRGDFVNDADRLQMGWTIRDQLDAVTLEWLAALPATRTLECARGPLLLCHGLDDDDMVRFIPPSQDSRGADDFNELVAKAEWRIVIAGHTHERFVHRAPGLTLVNAGTLSVRGTPGFAVLRLDEGYVQWFDVEHDGALREAERLAV